MHMEDGRIVETPLEARAGYLDRPTLVVLIVGMALVVGIFGMVYAGILSL